MTPSIRPIEPQDKDAFLALWSDYLAFYDVRLTPEVTDFTWMRLMDPSHPMKARLAVVDAHPLGFAIHHHHASTWVLGDDCYLEDLFVAQEARGMGLGRALLDDLVAHARAEGWRRLYWHTDEGNARARALYDQFTQTDGHIRYRMTL